MARAFLALGANLGDKVAALREAVRRLNARPGLLVLKASTIYRTPPWGKLDQDWFANAVIEVETALSPEALLQAVLATERAMGRERQERWGPRAIDIDVLLMGEERRDSAALTLPHPAMTERAFVLVPLAEIAPTAQIRGERPAAHLARLDRCGIEPLAPLMVEAIPA